MHTAAASRQHPPPRGLTFRGEARRPLATARRWRARCQWGRPRCRDCRSWRACPGRQRLQRTKKNEKRNQPNLLPGHWQQPCTAHSAVGSSSSGSAQLSSSSFTASKQLAVALPRAAATPALSAAGAGALAGWRRRRLGGAARCGTAWCEAGQPARTRAAAAGAGQRSAATSTRARSLAGQCRGEAVLELGMSERL